MFPHLVRWYNITIFLLAFLTTVFTHCSVIASVDSHVVLQTLINSPFFGGQCVTLALPFLVDVSGRRSFGSSIAVCLRIKSHFQFLECIVQNTSDTAFRSASLTLSWHWKRQPSPQPEPKHFFFMAFPLELVSWPFYAAFFRTIRPHCVLFRWRFLMRSFSFCSSFFFLFDENN